MSGFVGASLLLKISFILLIVGFVFNIIGFASPYWQSDGKYYNGLWRTCYKDLGCAAYKVTYDWFRATRAFAVLTFLGSIASLVFVILYMFAPKPNLRNKFVHLGAIIACFTTAIFDFLAVVIFAAFAVNMTWAWAFCVVSCLIFTAAGTVLFKDEATES